MLWKRLLVGTLLALWALGLLVLDLWMAPWYPFLLVTTLAGVVLPCYELLRLLPEPRPRPWLCYAGVVALALANWPAHLPGWGGSPWHWILGTFITLFLAFFLVAGESFRKPGGVVLRLAVALWLVTYLGLLPAFLVQLRWLPKMEGTLAVALAIFVPKVGDIGAYTFGRLLGRHRMTPVLSPKKTWEGAAGGLASSVVTALALNALSLQLLEREGPLLSWPAAVGFGVTVGIMGMLGDLMESLIKRDCEQKDASNLVPGFGGVLDVLDSILFSAPVAYLWLANRPL